MSKDKEPKDPSAADEPELSEEALEAVSAGAVRGGKRIGFTVSNFTMELNGSSSGYLKKTGD